MGDFFTSRLGAGRWLVLAVLLASGAALLTGRGLDVAYAAVVAVPLGGLAMLLHGSAITALIGEALVALGGCALGVGIGGPLIGLAVAIGMGGIVYLPRQRRRRPPRHRAGLSGMIAVLVLSAQTLVAGIDTSLSGEESPVGLLINCVWLVLATVICAGWPQRRRFAEAIARLGLGRPSLRAILVAITIGVLLVPAINLLSALIGVLFETQGWPVTSDDEVRSLFSGLMSPVGVLVIAITAGITEEIVVRGLLQPRFGLVVPALFFTALHAWQYRLDVLLPLLLLSLALGWVRARWDTTACVIAHGVYDLVIGALLLGGLT